MKWLNSECIGLQSSAPGSKRVWKWAEKHGYTEQLPRGYVLSTKFRDNVLSIVNQQIVVTEDMLQTDCLQANPSFKSNRAAILLSYLKSNGFLLLIQDSKAGNLYLSGQMKKECERLFELEGAATKDEFSVICQSTLENSGVAVNSRAVADAILNQLVAQGDAHSVELSDLGDDLFVSNKNVSNSKMTRSEISLD